MHEEPTPPLKEAKREEDGAKNLEKKILHPLFQKEEPLLKNRHKHKLRVGF
ncbi:hypothetical protein CWI37_1961p0010 [Hamiltosporidium tvaerminnensis]|uniref:Uncharacterized protein n=1 Tax=Hamiltosporidium tvaerminnensis TaxID=1176355 RepID=A0A4Q9KTW7_9MICR|nr:hypothetical protein CWI37_1961p0010 [Hamiltosporidium tvaerminnensis]